MSETSIPAHKIDKGIQDFAQIHDEDCVLDRER